VKVRIHEIDSYLDDSLIKDFDQQTLVSQTEMVIQLFLNLGFLISWKKSELTPQNFLFLGEHYRTDLVYCIVSNKTKKFSEGRSNRDVKVRIHEIEACCSHTRVDTRPVGTIGFHFENYHSGSQRLP
jgi:hypothetical protein